MRIMLQISLLSIAISSAASAIVIRHDVDGDKYLASEADYPAVASLMRTPRGYRECVATLIAPEWMITARHCTEGPRFIERVNAGGTEIEFTNDRKAVVDGIVRMQGGPGNDVALLHLAQPITDVAPIPIYDGRDEQGKVLRFVGWGDTGNGVTGRTGNDYKFRMAENRVDEALDEILVLKFDDPRDANSNALELEGVSGAGDSGGPGLLMTESGWQVAGISSAQRGFGQGGGKYGNEEIYIRASSIREWALEVMASRSGEKG